jgi:hypothetical protein
VFTPPNLLVAWNCTLALHPLQNKDQTNKKKNYPSPPMSATVSSSLAFLGDGPPDATDAAAFLFGIYAVMMVLVMALMAVVVSLMV